VPEAQLGSRPVPTSYGRIEAEWTTASDTTEFGAKALYTHDGGWRDCVRFRRGEAERHASRAVARRLPHCAFDLAAPGSTRRPPGSSSARTRIATRHLRETNPNPEAFRKASAVRLTRIWCSRRHSLPASSNLRPYAAHLAHGIPAALPAWPAARTQWPGKRRAHVELRLDMANPHVSLVTGVDLEWADSFLLEQQDAADDAGSRPRNAVRPAGKHYDYRRDFELWRPLYGQFEYALA
jgi:hypothetical protein